MRKINYPKISIITISFNDKQNLEKTINNVINQKYENKEFIVVDGGSKDGSQKMVEKYKGNIDVFISEPDKGIYDAMNKGVKYATGDFIIFMNAGDIFYKNNTIEEVFKKVNNWKDIDLIFGNCYKVYKEVSKISKAGKLKNLWKGMIFSHQSLFTKRYLLEEYPFDLNYPIGADFDFIFKMYNNKKNFLYVDEIISTINMEGVSNVKRIKSTIDRWKIVKKYKKDIFVDIFYLVEIVNIGLRDLGKKYLPKYLVNLIIKLQKN